MIILPILSTSHIHFERLGEGTFLRSGVKGNGCVGEVAQHEHIYPLPPGRGGFFLGGGKLSSNDNELTLEVKKIFWESLSQIVIDVITKCDSRKSPRGSERGVGTGRGKDRGDGKDLGIT